MSNLVTVVEEIFKELSSDRGLTLDRLRTELGLKKVTYGPGELGPILNTLVKEGKITIRVISPDYNHYHLLFFSS